MGTPETGFEDDIAVLSFFGKCQQRTSEDESPGAVERRDPTHIEVIRIFPNEDSPHRLVGALFLEQHEEWVTVRRYFDITDYNEWTQKQATENQAEDPQVMVA